MTDAKHPTRLAWIGAILEKHEGPLTRYAARITGDLESEIKKKIKRGYRLGSVHRTRG